MRISFHLCLPSMLGLVLISSQTACSDDANTGAGPGDTRATNDEVDAQTDAGGGNDTGTAEVGDTGGEQTDQGGEDPGNADQPDEGQPGEGCGGTLAADVLEEVVLKLLADAEWTAVNTHGQERGFALNLLGADVLNVGSAFLIETCQGEVQYVPFCEPDPETGLSKCLRMGCEERDIGYAEVYFTDGSTDVPDDPHAIDYDSTTYGGTVTYEPNPYRYWRTDQTVEETVDVTLNLDHGVTLTPPAGSAIDASHTGTVALTAVDFEVTDLSLAIDFANLSLDDNRPIHVSIERVEAGFAGSVTRADETLATITFEDEHAEGEDEAPFAWAAGCSL